MAKRKEIIGLDEKKLALDLILMAVGAGLSYVSAVAAFNHFHGDRATAKKALEKKKEIAKRLGRPLIQTNSFEDVIACDVVNPDHIDVEFESIGGLDAVKKSLYNLVILPLKRPELFSRRNLLGPQKGVLLYGPPGTGKTMLAKAIAKESGAFFINVRLSNLMGKWFGDAEKLVSAVFSLAHKLEPAIIFIDEVDSFLGLRRSDGNETFSTMKTIFMSLWDGFDTYKHAKVMVLGATNRPSELDEAILRRFTQSFEIGMPSRKDRVGILKVVLKDENVEDGVDFDHIAGLCEGYSGADLMELCKKAAYLSIQDFLEDEENGKPCEQRQLLQSDLESVIATSTRTSVAANEYNNKTQPGKVTTDCELRYWVLQSPNLELLVRTLGSLKLILGHLPFIVTTCTFVNIFYNFFFI